MSTIINYYESKPTVGRHDGERFLLQCSNCDEKLCYVWSTEPTKNIDFKIRSKCCYCDDYSFPVYIHGGFMVWGYDKPTENGPENVIPVVDIHNIDYNDTEVVIETKKVQND